MPQRGILDGPENGNEWRRTAVYVLQAVICVSLLAALFFPIDEAKAFILVGLVLASVNFLVSLVFSKAAMGEMSEKVALFQDAHEKGQQVEQLFAMTDMLQAAEDHEDAGAILQATAQRLLPEFSGALYVFNNSRDRLDLAKSWNSSESFVPCEALLPGNCWALKRGKTHINDTASDTLCCMHHVGSAATIEVPMLARGQVHGLLMLALERGDAHSGLMGVRRVARALADSMSLALSNIALREKLRTQSLRDPLTGLYNRRYMEDALERFVSLAEREGNPTSVLMIDLDNFKNLNDQHGHAKGDAVLRDVASQLVSALRPSDVVSRYGGEELVVILPNCGLDDAALKAETLRMRVEALSEAHGVAISASFGVASVPETATSPVDVIPSADASLYSAKQTGKNRVVCSERRASGSKDEAGPRLAVG